MALIKNKTSLNEVMKEIGIKSFSYPKTNNFENDVVVDVITVRDVEEILKKYSTNTVTKSFYECRTLSYKPSIFLAGPTLRNDYFENSWRKDAVRILEEKGFDGNVYIPESETGDYSAINLDDKGYPEWEWARLESPHTQVILFWVPRDLDTLPGFTTNVEFGRYITLCPEKVVLGYPKSAPKNTYLGQLYDRFNKDGVCYTLEETIDKALERLNNKNRKG